MSTSERHPARRYHHGDLRNALLEAAEALLGEVGLDGFSLREVARRAGVSHAASYNHFPDKTALARALAERAFGRLTEAMQSAAASRRDPLERLKAIGVGYVSFAVSQPNAFRFMFRPELCQDLAASGELIRAGQTARAQLDDAVQAALSAGALRPGFPDALSLAAWSMVHGLAHLMLESPQTAPLDRARHLADELVGLLIEGLRG